MRAGFVSLLVIFGLIATVLAIFGISYLQFSRSPVDVVKGKLNSKKILWSSDSRKSTQLSVSDDTLYALSSDGYISAIDPSSGEEKLNIKINGSIEYNFYLYEDFIYYVSPAESNPKPTSSRILYAVNAKTGQEVWERQLNSYVRSLNISDGNLYYTSHEEKKLFALNSLTGEPLWSFDMYVSAAGGSRPDAAKGITLIGVSAPDNQSSGDKLYALDSTSGKVLWTFPASSTTSAVSNAPILIDNETIYINFTDYASYSDDDFLYAIDLKTGKEKWKSAVQGNPGGSLSVSNGTVYLAKSYGYVYTFDKTNGHELWKIKAKDGQIGIKSSPSALYLVNNQDGSELSPHYGNLSNIDHNTGNVNWEFEENKTTFSNLAYFEDIVFVISTADGKIYSFR